MLLDFWFSTSLCQLLQLKNQAAATINTARSALDGSLTARSHTADYSIHSGSLTARSMSETNGAPAIACCTMLRWRAQAVGYSSWTGCRVTMSSRQVSDAYSLNKTWITHRCKQTALQL